jgi:hypothetical protein
VEAKRHLRSVARRKNVSEADKGLAWLRAEAAWNAVKAAARGGLPDDEVLRQLGVF